MSLADLTPDALADGFERLYARTIRLLCKDCGLRWSSRTRCAHCYTAYYNRVSNAYAQRRKAAQ